MLKTASNYINVIGSLVFQGTWDAATNTPTLQSSVGNKGDYYVVSVAGTTNLNGITDWQIGDWAIFNGSIWEKVDNTDVVVSVNGKIGAVVLTAADVGAAANTVNVLVSGLLSGGGPLTSNVTISLANVPYGNVTGLGTMATQNSNNVAITGGYFSNGSFANATIPSVASTFPNNFLANSTATLGNATITLGGTTSTVGNLTLTGATVTGSIALTNPTSASATFATSSLPLVPEGYVTVVIGGVTKKIPYYGV